MNAASIASLPFIALDVAYAVRDRVRAARTDGYGRLTGVAGLPAHATRGAVYAALEAANPRFRPGQVNKGLRLTPITAGLRDRVPVVDRVGVQLCLGDRVRVQIVGEHGNGMWQAEAVVSESHLPWGQLDADFSGVFGGIRKPEHAIHAAMAEHEVDAVTGESRKRFLRDLSLEPRPHMPAGLTRHEYVEIIERALPVPREQAHMAAHWQSRLHGVDGARIERALAMVGAALAAAVPQAA